MTKTTQRYLESNIEPDLEGHARIAYVMEYPQREPHLYEQKNVMSRKKQMVPLLLKILAKV